MTDPIPLRQQCRMTEIILGLLMHAGTEFQTEVCLLPGDIINLTTDEMDRLDGRWYEKIKKIGPITDLSGAIVWCMAPGQKHLWRRPSHMRKASSNAVRCAEHATTLKERAVHRLT